MVPSKVAVVEGVVLDVHGETLLRGSRLGPLGHGPALQHAVHLEPEVVVQASSGVSLDHEAGHPVRRRPTRLARVCDGSRACDGTRRGACDPRPVPRGRRWRKSAGNRDADSCAEASSLAMRAGCSSYTRPTRSPAARWRSSGKRCGRVAAARRRSAGRPGCSGSGELTHGTGASYQASPITAVRDWAAWGALAERSQTTRASGTGGGALAGPPRGHGEAARCPRRGRPCGDVDLESTPRPAAVEPPALYLHDTGWPFSGMLDDYVGALGSIYYPQILKTRMISVEACWSVAPGTGRHHEAMLLQKILDWPRFTELLAARRAGRAARRLDGGGPPLPRSLGVEVAALRAVVAAAVAGRYQSGSPSPRASAWNASCRRRVSGPGCRRRCAGRRPRPPA